MPRVMVWAPEVSPGPHPLARHGWQFEIYLSSEGGVGCFSNFTPGPHLTAGWTGAM